MARITFLPDDVTLDIEPATSLLECALQGDVPLTHACGGRARCSTCRVAIVEGGDGVCPRTDEERQMADRLHLAPCIRLACQTRVTGDTKVRRLVLDNDDLEEASELSRQGSSSYAGEEMQLAILFADIRGFTPFAESLLPYDLIHVLNRYFRRIGRVIEKHRGYIDNYIGDGILALFGCDHSPEPTLLAVTAALEMLTAVDELKPYLRQTYGKTFEIGIGIHFGSAVVGTVGWGDSQRRTVIGDSVNFASRVESANKIAGTKLLISAAAYAQVAERFKATPALTTHLKGKSGEHVLYEVTEN